MFVKLMQIQDIDLQLEELRTAWGEGKADREILKRQARALEIAKEIIEKRED